jgi:hypothetical protein
MSKKLLISFIIETEANKERLENEYDRALKDRHYRTIDDVGGIFYSIMDNPTEKFKVEFMRVIDIDTLEVETVPIKCCLDEAIYGLYINNKDLLEDDSVYVSALGISDSFDYGIYDLDYYCAPFEFGNKIIGLKEQFDGSKIDDKNIKYTFSIGNKDFELYLRDSDSGFKFSKEINDSDKELNVLHVMDIDVAKEDEQRFMSMVK